LLQIVAVANGVYCVRMAMVRCLRFGFAGALVLALACSSAAPQKVDGGMSGAAAFGGAAGTGGPGSGGAAGAAGGTDGGAADVRDGSPGETFPATGALSASDVATGPSGTVFVVGTLEGGVDLGGGTSMSAGAGDILLAAFDGAHRLLWQRRYGDEAAQGGGSLANDRNGAVLLGTTFKGTVDFGGGPLTSAGGNDVAVAKLDGSGNHQWSKGFGASMEQSIAGLAVDGAGRVVVGVSSNVPFALAGAAPPPDAGAAVGVTSSLGVLEPTSGNVIWSKAWAGASLRAVATDGADRVIVVGSFTQAVDLGGGMLTNAGHTDLFVAVFAPDGGHVWSKRFGGVGSDDVTSLDIDDSGNIVVAGSFDDTLDFGGPPLVSVLSPNLSFPSRDIFIAKLTAAGTHVWSRQLGEPEQAQWATGLGHDRAGNVLLALGFAGTVDFGGGPLAAARGPAAAVKLDGAGAYVWQRQLPAPAQAIGPAMNDGVLVVGAFPGGAVLPGSAATIAGGSNVFLIEYPP
jgi:hypothetical protein